MAARRQVSDAELSKALNDIVFQSKRGAGVGVSGLVKLLHKDGIAVSAERVKRWLAGQSKTAENVPVGDRDGLYRKRSMDVFVPNQTQNADVLFLSNDGGFKYALVVVDLASRYTAAVPMKNKDARTVLAAIQSIWKKGPLRRPENLKVDAGSEFQGVFSRWMEDNGVNLRRNPTADHRANSMVESHNSELARRLYAIQKQDEVERGGTNREWVGNLEGVLASMNAAENRLIGMSADTAIKKDKVYPLAKQRPPDVPLRTQKPVLAIGTRVRVLLPEPIDKGRFRATDETWSKKIYEVSNYSIEPERPIQYQVKPQDRLTRGRWYVRGMLLLDLRQLSRVKANPDTSAPKKPVPPEDSPGPNEQGQYEVEKIVDRRKTGGRVEYEVKWKGYSSKDNTWEPRASLIKQVPGLVRDFEKKNKK
jgi:hypothetical protein